MTSLTGAKGGLRAAFFFILFAATVLASGKYFQYWVGFLRTAAFLCAAAWLWRSSGTPRDVPAYALVVAGFSVLSLGHAFSSVYVWVSLQHALNILLAGTLLCLVVLLFEGGPHSPSWKAFLPALAAVAAAEVAVAGYQRFAGGDGRPHGTFSNPMFLSEFLAVAALFMASRFLEAWKRKGYGRIAWGAGTVLFLWGALSLTGSRGVIVALVPAFAVLAASRFGIVRGAKAFLLALPALAVLGWHSMSRFFFPDVYNYGRWIFWRSALRVFESKPFGAGLGGYKYLWFTTQEPFPQAFRHYAKYPVTPHNEYLEVLTGLGFPGFLLFVAVLALPLWYAARGWKGIPEDRRWAAEGALAGLVLTGTNALVNFNFHEFGVVFTDVLLLGILWSCIPTAATGTRIAMPSWPWKAGAGFALLAGILSASLLAGAVALGRGQSLVAEQRYDSAETAFRAALHLDPWRATIPDALSALDHRRFVAAAREGSPAADELLVSAIRWQGIALERCPLEQGYAFRQANLFIERYRRTRDPRDLEAVLLLAGETLRINPYLVEALWMRAQAFEQLARTADAVDTLQRAVSVEPNFCRAYAKLAELTRPSDSARSEAFEARAAECREHAKTRAREDGERWLVVEPGPSTQ